MVFEKSLDRLLRPVFLVHSSPEPVSETLLDIEGEYLIQLANRMQSSILDAGLASLLLIGKKHIETAAVGS